ncbi:hypothetical protein VTK73DRAFT_6249 [Phialemonium thermophilum]|uniref:Non-homologous end-joining factor 1 n=1 Tax=Phialemonium thermophilum TaxID=223376 RepID=A0ABR3WK69_9PEZI
METPGRKPWRPLRLTGPGIPTLLVCTEFTAQSYKVQITDMANVWTEALEKKPVIMRSLREDTSIDPTEGPDQIQKLLDLLRAAFDPTSPAHGDTSLELSRASAGEGDSDSLVIRITVILPGGLRPLRWPMYLKKEPQSAIATELVLPLIQAHHTVVHQISELVAALREKDKVISRLVDKLEAMGTGLEYVFTSLSGRKKVTRAAAEERIKGLAPFRESDFRSRQDEASDENGPADVLTLLDSVFDGKGLTYSASLDIDESPELNDWWTKIGRGEPMALVDRGKATGKRVASPKPAGHDGRGGKSSAEEDESDEFQVQVSPPIRGAARGRDASSTHRGTHEDGGSETSDGDEVAESLERTKVSETTRATAHGGPAKQSTSRLGMIGKRAKPPSSPPPEPERPPSPVSTSPPHQSNIDDDGTPTASDVSDAEEEENEPPPHVRASPKPPHSSPVKRPGLGYIGGRANRASKTPPPHGRPAEDAVTPKRGKLGAIGRGNVAEAADIRGRVATASPTKDLGAGETSGAQDEDKAKRQRETSVERADRKRAELQRELEKRAAGGPAKKKRKF